MTGLFEKARLQLERKLPFVLYRKPDADAVVGMFQTSEKLRLADRDSPCFIFAPFDKSEYAWMIAEAESETMTVSFAAEEFSREPKTSPADATGEQDYRQLVKNAVRKILDGHFEKVVCSRKQPVVLSDDFDVFDTFSKMASAYPSAFVYLWFHPKTDIWMAATPEKLLEVKQSRFKTMSLAGTQKFSGNEHVAWGEKETEEQRIVTDFIWNSVEPFASEMEISEPYTYRAANLLHIRTDITGEFQSAGSLSQVVDTLHPTPAVGGLPKQNAFDFIKENENYKREFYTGYLGEWKMQPGTELYVNLRCMKICESRATLFVGCGITKDSDPEKEFLETVGKTGTMMRVIV